MCFDRSVLVGRCRMGMPQGEAKLTRQERQTHKKDPSQSYPRCPLDLARRLLWLER